MSKLQDLINRLCPNGVEYKPISQIAFIPRDRINIKKIPNGLYIGVENLLKDKAGMLPATEMPAVHDVLKFETNDVLIGNIRPYLKKIWLADKGGGTNGDVLLLRLNSDTPILPKFFYYLVSSDNFFSFHNQYAKGAKMPRGDKQKIMEFTIPVPPIEVQEEIVKILDRFAEYAAELQAELQARKEQYEYYRNLLLSFNPSASDDEPTLTTWGGRSYKIAWKTMGEIVKIMNGKDYKHIEKGGIPVYGSGGIMTYIDDYIYDGESVLLPRKGSIGKIYYVNNKFWTVDTIYWTKINQKIIKPKFLYYFLKTQNTERKAIKAGAVPSMTQEIYNKILIPIPPIELQEKIVAILDRFETLVNDLTQGLPAEIAAVREQYEYYRNKLLTFKQLA